ncbi:hypothetical protein [Carboxylicivirga caseinilyticus]|uniref:hypothetical protein n=1 Tax=Carboxylicivirga caseinilyticus TaxID=3417572 RepID=UPI003D33B34C|nr:hypothetical protein [Marinilabiliaceae bacterium A049]
MLNRLITITIVLTVLSSPFYGHAQTNELKKHLNEKEIKKLSSSEKLINKGNKLIDAVKSIQEEVDALKNADGRIKTNKINKRNKKIAEAKLKAAIFYEDGYAKHIGVLDKRIKELENQGNAEASKTRNEVKSLTKKAKKQYNKSERLSSPEDMIEMVELAQENQGKAIELQERYLLSVLDNQPEEKPIVEEAETVISNVPEEVTDTTTIVETTTLVSEPVEEITTGSETINESIAEVETPIVPVAGATGSETIIATVANEVLQTETTEQATPVVEEIIEPVVTEPVKQVKDVFLTIQFLADKEKASEEKLQQAYSGNLEIIEKTGSGWYRYSVGKFTDVTKARETMQNEGIKGFIVAYNKDERISVKEALEIINNQ